MYLPLKLYEIRATFLYLYEFQYLFANSELKNFLFIFLSIFVQQIAVFTETKLFTCKFQKQKHLQRRRRS